MTSRPNRRQRHRIRPRIRRCSTSFFGWRVETDGVAVTGATPSSGRSLSHLQAAQAGMQDTRLFRRGVMDAGRVAPAGHDGPQQRKTLVIPGMRNRILAFAVRLSPRVLVTRISAYLQP
jgi:short-subunit dehydrogenase